MKSKPYLVADCYLLLSEVAEALKALLGLRFCDSTSLGKPNSAKFANLTSAEHCLSPSEIRDQMIHYD